LHSMFVITLFGVRGSAQRISSMRRALVNNRNICLASNIYANNKTIIDLTIVISAVGFFKALNVGAVKIAV